MKKLFLFLVMILATVGVFAQNQRSRTVVIAKIEANGGDGNDAAGAPQYQIAAFVGDEANPRTVVGYPEWVSDNNSPNGGYMRYIIPVDYVPEGNTADPGKGKAIRFEIGDRSTGLAYKVKATSTEQIVLKDDEYTYGSSASPVVLTLNKPMNFTITLNEVEKGKTYKLADWLKAEGETEAVDLPYNLRWEAGQPVETITPTGAPVTTVEAIDGITANNKTGVLTISNNVNVWTSFTLQVGVDSEAASWVENWSEGQPLASKPLMVILHPTAITLKKTTLEIENNDYGRSLLDQFIWNDVDPAYTVTPEGATDYPMWEVQEQTDPILEFNGQSFNIIPQKTGTARIRPYIQYRDANTNKEVTITPTNWITVTITVPVERIEINRALYASQIDFDPNEGDMQADIKANVFDTKIYDRMAKMVKIYPEYASNTNFRFVYEGTDKALTISGRSIKANKAGSFTVKVISEGKRTEEQDAATGAPTGGSETVSPYATEEIHIMIKDPATKAEFKNNGVLTVTVQDDEEKDITADVKAFITYNSLSGNYNQNAGLAMNVTEGTSVTVTADGEAGTATTLPSYTFKAHQRAGESEVTKIAVTLSWWDYDNWMGYATADGGTAGAGELQMKTSDPYSFQVYVSKHFSLQYFTADYTEAISGKEVTLTLSPVPANADYDANAVNVSFTYDVDAFALLARRAYANDAESLQKALTRIAKWSTDVISVSQKQVVSTDISKNIVYKFMCEIPGNVKIAAVSGTAATTAPTPMEIQKNGAALTAINVGYNLALDKGWQWRSNPWGVVTQAKIANVYNEDKLQEIRTQDYLLFNEKGYGLYGSMVENKQPIHAYECYKVKMNESYSTVVNGSQNELLVQSNLPNNVKLTGTGVTVSLAKGWNWIGCPYFYNRDLNSVLLAAAQLTGVTIPDELLIASKTDFAIFKKSASATAGPQGVFSGALTYLHGGQGYLVYNPSDAITLNFPFEVLAYDPGNEDANSAGVKGYDMGGSLWQYDHSKFMNNMALVSVLDGITNPQDYSIGAFVGDECRGESFVQNGKMFITVHCDAGEYVKFKLYNTLTGDVQDIQEGVRAQSRIGSLKSPFLMHAIATGIQGVGGEQNATETYDLAGRRINGQQRGVSIQRTSNGVRKVMVK